MVWKIEFERHALKELKSLGRPASMRVLKTLEMRIAQLPDPRELGDPLVGEWSGYWRYRIGDYRVIAKFYDEVMVVSVVKIGHRREVYR